MLPYTTPAGIPPTNPSTIFITGANGLIGFRTMLEALDKGHYVRIAVRSIEKAKEVSSNPAVQKLRKDDLLSFFIIPDFTVEGAFDAALEGATHIIHVGSPVARPDYDPMKDIFEPTLKMAANLRAAAQRVDTMERMVIASSIVANLGLVPPEEAVSATTRPDLPEPLPERFDDVFSAYIAAKVLEKRESDEFVKDKSPLRFTISHVFLGYTFGRNELVRDADAMQVSNSSNNFLMKALVGGQLPFPIHGAFVHIDDAAELLLLVALLDGEEMKSFHPDVGIATKVDYSTIFVEAEKAFPRAVESGALRRGTVPTLPVEYDMKGDPTNLLRRDLKTFNNAVLDVATQYLETIGVVPAGTRRLRC
ncbi:putative cinnamoyl-CoA reductase [Xylariomycetidae sp. FL0641]|nr:putative cinnamoyl-CoA reductase [Xylariomycetidae sp. FL0641]